jgi:transcriptional regulator of acetoin/glycerol metabolism
MDTDELVQAIISAHAEALAAQEAMHVAAARRADLIRQAASTDVSIQSIAEALGMTRQRVYQMAK